MTAGPVILPFGGHRPQIAADAFIAPTAVIIGDVVIGARSSIWFGAVLRGDVAPIRIGCDTNVQDGTVIHANQGGPGTAIGDGITIGHQALLHACTLESGCFIGMQACVMDDAVVQARAMVAAGALVTPGRVIPAGELWAGRPAKLFRAMTEAERTHIPESAAHYVELAAAYRG